MSESRNGFIYPPEQDFNTVGFEGSMQQVLQENVGNYVIVDFLLGNSVLETKQGVLTNVSAQFLVLFDDINLQYVMCDIFSVKFVTFLEGRSASTYPSLDQTAMPGSASADTPALDVSARTPSQAAYAHAVRRSGRI